jgi:hypothetical protein
MAEERVFVAVLLALGDKAEEFLVVTYQDGLTDLLVLPEHAVSRLLGNSLSDEHFSADGTQVATASATSTARSPPTPRMRRPRTRKPS